MLITLLDILKANQADPMIGLIEDVVVAHPELSFGSARTINDIFYETLARTSVPNTDGAFRDANTGSTPSKSGYEKRRFECFMLQAPLSCDKQVADSYRDGADAYISMEAAGILEGVTQGLCKQFYYGLSALGNPKGFPGLIDMYDSTNRVVDAGGTSANTGSSVWMIKFGPLDVQWVWGNNSTLGFTPMRMEKVPDPTDATKTFLGYSKELMGRPGLQVGRQINVVRIKKVTADVGHTLNDGLINQGLALFPTGNQPDLIAMTRRSNQQLQSSRTATNPTGQPAPFPREIVGIGGQNIPIVLTDAISNAEPLTL